MTMAGERVGAGVGVHCCCGGGWCCLDGVDDGDGDGCGGCGCDVGGWWDDGREGDVGAVGCGGEDAAVVTAFSTADMKAVGARGLCV